MATCKVCLKDRDLRECKCRKRYERHIAAGRIPPQFKAAGVDFDWFDWLDVQEARRIAMSRPGATPESIEAETERKVEACLNAHLLKLEPPAQSTTSIEAELDAYYPY